MTDNPDQVSPLLMESTRICRTCGIEQPITDFRLSKNCRGGRRYECKSCHARATQERRSKQRTEPGYLVNNPRQTRKRDASITHICAWCGTPFHPWKGVMGKNMLYCSRDCRSRAALVKVNGDAAPAPTPLPVRNDFHKETLVSHEYEKGKALSEEWKESGEHWDKVAAWYAERTHAERKRRSEQGGVYTTVASEGRTITLAGYGARLMVKGANLVVQHGRTYSTEDCPSETLYRGIHGVSSIVWLVNGGSGGLSVQALKWCASQNITMRMLTNRGEHLATIFPSPDAPPSLGFPGHENGRPDVRLRRAQYNLAPSGQDVPLARAIILRKLAAQRKCLDAHPELPDRERGFAALTIAKEWLSLDPPTPATNSLDGIRLYEARASKGYFMAWKGLALQVDLKADKNWPPPWKLVSERTSALTRWVSPRNATNPAQACLNFAYAMLESQVRAALNAIGADVVCGILHTDRDGRDSLVFDCMEPLRGEVDDLFLRFIGTHTFSMGDFNTMTTGAITVHPMLCKVLAEMVRVTQRRADDEARWFRAQLVDMNERADKRKPRVHALIPENDHIGAPDENDGSEE